MAQHSIKLDKARASFVDELRLDVSPGDTIQFESEDGDFAIYIINAISFLSIKEPDLKERVNAATTISPVYTVQMPTVEEEIIYSVYCITDNNWPAAPPRIIIVV
jgi:hypothetical protein